MAITRVAANAIDVVLAFGRFSRKLDTPTVTEPIPTGCFLKKSKQPIQAWRLTQNLSREQIQSEAQHKPQPPPRFGVCSKKFVATTSINGGS